MEILDKPKLLDMENLIEVLSEWSETPQDFFRLAITLLDKNKKLGYISEDKTIQDYLIRFIFQRS